MLDTQRTYLTCGGTETYLHFIQGFPLPDMCGFRVLDDDEHYARLDRTYLRPIADAAARSGHGLILDALVWRASSDHMLAAGYREADVQRLNALGVARARQSLSDWRAQAGIHADDCPALVAGDVGPRGDAYARGAVLTPETARAYHRPQLEALCTAGVDLLTALTLPSLAEALGVAKAAREIGMPIVVSPTVETHGHLPDGTPLGELVQRIDDATGGYPSFYMVNCAHPSHVLPVLDAAAHRHEPWLQRFRGFRANASAKSHAELDESPTLDRGNPRQLGQQMAALARRFDLKVVGGCCGTDTEHIVAIAEHCA